MSNVKVNTIGLSSGDRLIINRIIVDCANCIVCVWPPHLSKKIWYLLWPPLQTLPMSKFPKNFYLCPNPVLMIFWSCCNKNLCLLECSFWFWGNYLLYFPISMIASVMSLVSVIWICSDQWWHCGFGNASKYWGIYQHIMELVHFLKGLEQ